MIKNEVYSCFSKVFLLVSLLCCVSTMAFAGVDYDFSAVNDDGVTIYYRYITDATTKSVDAEVSIGNDDYSGDINIPEIVKDDKGVELSVTSIGSYAFRWRTTLTSVTIPNSVTNIGGNAFMECKNLTSVTIGSSVKFIDYQAFLNCSNLKEVILLGNTLPTCFGFDDTSYNITLYCIPSLVAKCLAKRSLWNIYSFATTVTLADGERLSKYITDDIKNNIAKLKVYGEINNEDIALLKEMATFGVGKLSVLDLSEATASKVDLIGMKAFEYCGNLTRIILPQNVTSIGDYAFSACDGLTSVTIGKSVTEIRDYAFKECSKLEDVTLYGNKLPTCGTDVFKDVTLSNVKLYCKKVLETTCGNIEPWSGFKTIEAKQFSITIPNSGYATGCFYDDLDFTGLDESQGVNAYIVSAFSFGRGTVLLTRATKIPAGTGFIVTGEAGTTYKIPATTTDYVYSNMLVGVLEKSIIETNVDDYTNYMLGKIGDDAAFIPVLGGRREVLANNAYLQIPTSAITTSSTSAGAKTSLSLSFDDEDDTTGISAIKERSDSASDKTFIYNLNGQRKQSLTKGLNIVNGKKIFVK